MIEKIVKKASFDFSNRRVEVGITTKEGVGEVVYENIDYHNKDKSPIRRYRKVENPMELYSKIAENYSRMFYAEKNG